MKWTAGIRRLHFSGPTQGVPARASRLCGRDAGDRDDHSPGKGSMIFIERADKGIEEALYELHSPEPPLPAPFDASMR